MSLGQKIRIYRREKGFTQSELAEILGVTVQAVSKWETDSGMPDITQLVPLSKSLGVSADVLLENIDEDVSNTLNQISKIDCDMEFVFDYDKAKRIYEIAKPCFEKYPTNATLAYHCLVSFAKLIKLENANYQDAFSECNRYMNCIEKYEENTDSLYKSYYVMSNALRTLNKEKDADAIMNKIPDIFGDKLYWEAEVEFNNQNYDVALRKCKESFALKARYVSRCIRLARMINEKVKGVSGLTEQHEYSKYMLRMIDSFLSGGEYLPYRMVYQKIALLCGMVHECICLHKYDEAIKYTYDVAGFWKDFNRVLSAPEEYTSLMFPHGDDDGWWNITDERFSKSWNVTIERLRSVDAIKNTEDFKTLENMFI